VYAKDFTGISLMQNPQSPQPGDEVTLSIRSFSQNIQTAHIAWYADDVLLQEGIGLTQKTIIAPKLGSSITIHVQINNIEQARTTITPGAVDIMWEAHTSIPPYYKGRALPTESSKITLWAIPYIHNNTSPKKLIFHWYENTRYLQYKSGEGRDSITIDAPRLYAHKTISVTVTDANGVELGKSEVRIANVEPELILYPQTPLLGTLWYTSAQSGVHIPANKEYTFVAQPYYFSITTPQDLTYTWHLTQIKAIQNSKNTLTITHLGASPRISVEVTHPHILLQTAQTSYSPTHLSLSADDSQENARPSLFEQTAP